MTDMKKLLLSFIILCLGGVAASAQTVVTIADLLNATGKVSISQPEALNARLIAHAVEEAETPGDAATSVGGFRILVFSGNNANTAKNAAESRAEAIGERFPEWTAYVTYDAPYWRLRVGDFTMQEEAAIALAELKKAFPAFAREMRVVRDRINVK